MPSLSPWLKAKFFTDNNSPLVGGKVYTYSAGTTNNLNTYTDYTLTTANANPIILNARGEADIWLSDNVAYKFVIKDSNDVTIESVDNVFGAGFGSGLLGATLQNVSIASTTLEESTYTLKESGAVQFVGADNRRLMAIDESSGLTYTTKFRVADNWGVNDYPITDTPSVDFIRNYNTTETDPLLYISDESISDTVEIYHNNTSAGNALQIQHESPDEAIFITADGQTHGSNRRSVIYVNGEDSPSVANPVVQIRGGGAGSSEYGSPLHVSTTNGIYAGYFKGGVSRGIYTEKGIESENDIYLTNNGRFIGVDNSLGDQTLLSLSQSDTNQGANQVSCTSNSTQGTAYFSNGAISNFPNTILTSFNGSTSGTALRALSSSDHPWSLAGYFSGNGDYSVQIGGGTEAQLGLRNIHIFADSAPPLPTSSGSVKIFANGERLKQVDSTGEKTFAFTDEATGFTDGTFTFTSGEASISLQNLVGQVFRVTLTTSYSSSEFSSSTWEVHKPIASGYTLGASLQKGFEPSSGSLPTVENVEGGTGFQTTTDPTGDYTIIVKESLTASGALLSGTYSIVRIG